MRIYGESIAGFCSVMPMKKPDAESPAIDETSRADALRWGGARAYVRRRSRDTTASKPSLLDQLNTKKIERSRYTTDE